MSERGSATLWLLGLSVSVLMLGGIAFDLWRGVAQRRELAALADAAAVAAASGVDVAAWRVQGRLVLDPAAAVWRARELIEARPDGADLVTAPVVVVSGDQVTVTLEGRLTYTFLGMLVDGDGLAVTASSTAVAIEP